jgi:cation diffusion facilitator family transporter
MWSNLKKSISTRTGATRLSLAVVIVLIIIKIVVSVISNSISIIAQAADSLLDLLAIIVTYVAVIKSTEPADKQHPFGHGKMEGMSALIQAVLILGAGGYIVYSAIVRIVNRTLIETGEGIVVMIISIFASFFLSRHLLSVAKTTGSMAIEASAKNIRADVFSAAGVLAGLILVRFTGLIILDPIMALIMAAFVLKSGFDVTKGAFLELTDTALPMEEQTIIAECITKYNTSIVNYHSLRTRRSGKERFIDLHLVMPRNASVEESHRICDDLEQDIKDELSDASISIHVEPCTGQECSYCRVKDCSLRNKQH